MCAFVILTNNAKLVSSLHPSAAGLPIWEGPGQPPPESLWRRGLGGPARSGCAVPLYCAPVRASDEHSVGWPSGTTGFKTGREKEPTSEVDSFDVSLAEKALGKDGSCHQGHRPPTPK